MVEATETEETRFSVIPDPLPDRPLTDAQCPKAANKPLEDSQIFGDNDLPDWRLLKDFMAREGPISKPQIMRLLNKTLQVFSSEANLV